mmetsp:Transcript_3018/g.10554  ORF Transcript_3018/g.10554 Transcript_3018/m.10554 type:complete len:446 (-) Transcript_3018:4-1341(-)
MYFARSSSQKTDENHCEKHWSGGSERCASRERVTGVRVVLNAGGRLPVIVEQEVERVIRRRQVPCRGINTLSRENLEEGHHACAHMVVNVAVGEPDARAIGNHIKDRHSPGEDAGDIDAGQALVKKRLSVPVGGVEVDLSTHGQRVPANPLKSGHGVAGQVVEQHAVDAVHQVALLEVTVLEELVGNGVSTKEVLHVVLNVVAHVLVRDRIEGEELAVDVLGPTVLVGHSLRSDNNRAHQASVRVSDGVHVAGVEVGSGAPVTRARARAIRDIPLVREAGAGRHTVPWEAAAVVGVLGSLELLAVAEAKRVDGEVVPAAVDEVHLDGVSDLCVDGRAQEAQVLPLGGALDLSREAPVRVADVQRLDVGTANAVRALSKERLRLGVLVERYLLVKVHTRRGIVPLNFLSSYEILSVLRLTGPGEQHDNEELQQQRCSRHGAMRLGL